MNWLLGAEIAAYAVWLLSMIYHRRDVKDERGRLVVLRSNNFAYGVVLVGLSATIIVDRIVNLTHNELILANAFTILAGLIASAISMFIYNKIQ